MKKLPSTLEGPVLLEPVVPLAQIADEISFT
jgi:hypothetical protein